MPPKSSAVTKQVSSTVLSPVTSVAPLVPIVEDTRKRSVLMENIRSTLQALGENVHREGLKETPKRYAKSMEFLTSGYNTNIDALVGSAVFHENTRGIVFIKEIELFSLCEHHLLPFFGRAHIAYLPSGRIIGLSKIPRIVDAFSRRLQVQERLTQQIAEELLRILNPRGVAVIIEANHLCMMMRGVEKQESSTLTRCLLGEFESDPSLRQELQQLLKNKF